MVLTSGVVQLDKGDPVNDAVGGEVIFIQLGELKRLSDWQPQASMTTTVGQKVPPSVYFLQPGTVSRGLWPQSILYRSGKQLVEEAVEKSV
jgi:hypothetical protein